MIASAISLSKSRCATRARARTERLWTVAPAMCARRMGSASPGKLSALDRRGEQPREPLVDAGQGFDDERAYFGIGDDLGGCGQHRETPARPRFARGIEVERGDEDAAQFFAHRRLGEQQRAKGLAHFRPIARIGLNIERLLVAERGVEARPVHAGRRAQIVERSRCEAVAPERVPRLRQRELRPVGARAPSRARRRRRAARFFLYHLGFNC